MTNIAINGFGRIGRSIMRSALLREDIRVVAINDICDWDILSYLLEHDTTHGLLQFEVSHRHKMLTIGDMPPIRTLNYKNQDEIDFASFGADIVIESSGQLLTTQSLSHHCNKGIKKVILSASPTDDMPVFALGVNTHKYAGESIFSNASCTANALAPLCKIIHKAFGIESVSFCITHSYTNEQSLLDSVYPNNKRRSRAAAQNIIPTNTGATDTIVRLLPELRGKVGGHSVRVPVSNVLLLDVTFMLSSATESLALNECIIDASRQDMKGIVGIDYKHGVSSDFVGNSHSVIFVPDLSYVVNGTMARIMAWCDNEWGYANRILDMARMCVNV